MYDWDEERRLRLRLSAIQCWYKCDDDIRAAVLLFKSRNPGLKKINYARFIRDAVRGLESRFSLHTPASTGRPATLPREKAELAVELLWKGYESEGQQRYYRSIDQAVRSNPGLKAICDEHDITPRTLLRAMVAAEPRCRRRRQVVKRLLSVELKKERRLACEKLLLWPVEQLCRTFWIDAATIYIVPKGMKVFAPPDADMVITDDRLPSHSSQLQKLRFYICINAILGPVAIKFVTGTSDLEDEVLWLVSRAGQGRLWGGCCWGGGRAGGQVSSRGGRQSRRQSSKQSCCWVVALLVLLLPACALASWLHQPSASAAAVHRWPAPPARTAGPARTARLHPRPSLCCWLHAALHPPLS